MEKKICSQRVDLDKTILVNFTEEMIPKYHEWMQDTFLLESTCTDPLSIEEVLSMCNSWKTDPKKYTYIICDKIIYNQDSPSRSMIGDVNIFINDESEGEINIMVAEAMHRNKGIASEVLEYIIVCCRDVLRLRRLCAKISQTNENSQRLFVKKGFVEYSRIPEFEEIHYMLDLTN